MAANKRYIRKTLEDALSIIEQGWCTGQYKKGDRHCTLGALAAASDLFIVKATNTYDHEGHLELVRKDGVKAKVFSGFGDPQTVEERRFVNAEGVLCEALRETDWWQQDYEEYGREPDGSDLAEFNDDQPSKKPVVRLFQKAIESVS